MEHHSIKTELKTFYLTELQWKTSPKTKLNLERLESLNDLKRQSKTKSNQMFCRSAELRCNAALVKIEPRPSVPRLWRTTLNVSPHRNRNETHLEGGIGVKRPLSPNRKLERHFEAKSNLTSLLI